MDISSIFSFFVNLFYVAAFLFVLVLGLLYKFQDKILYMPVIGDQPRSPLQNPPGVRNPGDRGLEYQDVSIQTKDSQTIKGWLCLQPNSTNVPTVIYMHENAGNIGTRIFYMEYYFKIVQVNILLVAYRGYSDSTGVANEAGLQLDGEAIVDYALNNDQIDKDKVFIHGRSLGGAVTAHVMTQKSSKRVNHLVSQDKIAGVILENTFTSIGDMVDVMFSKIKFFKRLVQRNFWSSIEKVPLITQPILFIICIIFSIKNFIAMKDEIVPVQQMIELSSRAKSARFTDKYVIENGTHNGNWALDIHGYFGRIKEFIKIAQIKN